jgi:hypothetical protein
MSPTERTYQRIKRHEYRLYLLLQVLVALTIGLFSTAYFAVIIAVLLDVWVTKVLGDRYNWWSLRKEESVMPLQLRRVERLENGEFKQIQFSELKTGDHYKLYDDGENPFEDGSQVYVALSDAEPCEPKGNYMVRSDDPKVAALRSASDSVEVSTVGA